MDLEPLHAFSEDGTPSRGAQAALDALGSNLDGLGTLVRRSESNGSVQLSIVWLTSAQQDADNAVTRKDYVDGLVGELTSAVGALPTLQAGKITMSPVVAEERISMPVEFDRPFASPPLVIVTPESGVPNVEMRTSPSQITTDGFQMNFWRATSTDTSVMWLAIGA